MSRKLFEMIGSDGLIVYEESGGGLRTKFVKLSSFISAVSGEIKMATPMLSFIGDMGTIAHSSVGGRPHRYVITREHIEPQMDFYSKKIKNVLVPNLLWDICVNGGTKVCAVERCLRDITIIGQNILKLKLYHAPFSNIHNDCKICFGSQQIKEEIAPLQFLGSKFNKDLDYGYPGGIEAYFLRWKNFSYEKDTGNKLYEKLAELKDKERRHTVESWVFE